MFLQINIIILWCHFWYSLVVITWEEFFQVHWSWYVNLNEAIHLKLLLLQKPNIHYFILYWIVAWKVFTVDSDLGCYEDWNNTNDYDVWSATTSYPSCHIQLWHWVRHNIILLWIFQWLSGKYSVYKRTTVNSTM